jgi:two-component system chemotaxis response regulator CheB
MLNKKIRVLIVDDSAVIRNILSSNLSKFSDIEVLGTASEPYKARDMILQLNPDVITLDIEMPRMDGLEFTKVLMKHRPIPIVIVSALVEGKCEISLQALEAGAVEIFPKPSSDISRELPKLMNRLADKIRAASKSKPRRKIGAAASKIISSSALIKTTDKVIAIGASTGGTEAIRRILQGLPPNTPGIAIVQHMPALFTKAFANRLNSVCVNLNIKEAEDGESLITGKALIAPGDKHLLLKRSGAKYYVRVKEGPQVCGHCPSVEVLFNSFADIAGRNGMGIILTGMGRDGANGLLKMRNAGAKTIAQDEKSSVVFGMPKEALEIGAADKGVELRKIANTAVSLLTKSR